VLVAYNDVSGRDPVLVASRLGRNENRFSPVTRVSQDGEAVFSFFDPTFINVAFDSNNTAYIVYADFADPRQPNVRLAISKKGKKFKRSKVIATDRIVPHIAIGKDDSLYVTFTDLLNVGLIKSTNNGKSFSSEAQVFSNMDRLVLTPFVIVDAKGDVSVTWDLVDFERPVDGNANDIFLSRSTDGGQTFGRSVNLSFNSGFSARPSGSADRDGNLFILWTDDSTANTEAFMVRIPAQ
jgi:hypothetical protein